MAKQKAARELPSSLKAAAEKKGFVWQDRTTELSKWGEGVVVEGTFMGFKPGKKFTNKSEASTLVKFRVEGKSLVYACPAVLLQALEDVQPNTQVIIVCLGQTLKIKDRKELAWDFEVAVMS